MNPGHRQGPLVAIVDDEEDIITYLTLALEDHGYRVVATTSPTEAMDLLKQSLPDAICLDLLMPEQTGFSLYKEIMRHPDLRRSRIVILSGLAVRQELPALLERLGGIPPPAAFIDKPVQIDELLDELDGLLARPTGGSP
jgi:CheY-like chemotaxis protein